MSEVTLEGRLIAAHIVNHQDGSKAAERHGSQSMSTKLVSKDGLATDTQDECVLAAKRIISTSIAAKLPCSAIYFAELGDNQPETPEAIASALEAALEEGFDVWLSRRGKLTVGINTTGQKAQAKAAAPKVKQTKAQQEALAAFLKA